MKPKQHLRIQILTAVTALSIGALSVAAEEVSEHLMTAVSGTQISGYVSTSMSWMVGTPLETGRPTLWSLHEALSQPTRQPHLPFDPLSTAPFGKVLEPENSTRHSVNRPGGDFGVIIYSGGIGNEEPPSHQMPDSSSFGLSAVPEPGTLALLGLGAVGAYCRSRRGKNRLS